MLNLTSAKTVFFKASFLCLCAIPALAEAQSDLETSSAPSPRKTSSMPTTRIPTFYGDVGEIEMPFTVADLEGNGQFNYVVAGYNVFYKGTLKVFRLSGGELTLPARLREAQISGVAR